MSIPELETELNALRTSNAELALPLAFCSRDAFPSRFREFDANERCIKLLEGALELLKAQKPEWIVNSIGELGIRIGGRFLFLYKGNSIDYADHAPEPGEDPLMWRKVGKREFGEVCHPFNWWDKHGHCNFPEGKYDVPLERGLGSNATDEELAWKPLPTKLEEATSG